MRAPHARWVTLLLWVGGGRGGSAGGQRSRREAAKQSAQGGRLPRLGMRRRQADAGASSADERQMREAAERELLSSYDPHVRFSACSDDVVVRSSVVESARPPPPPYRVVALRPCLVLSGPRLARPRAPPGERQSVRGSMQCLKPSSLAARRSGAVRGEEVRGGGRDAPAGSSGRVVGRASTRAALAETPASPKRRGARHRRPPARAWAHACAPSRFRSPAGEGQLVQRQVCPLQQDGQERELQPGRGHLPLQVGCAAGTHSAGRCAAWLAGTARRHP